jgi:dUTP pyrophosphatase
LFNNSDNDFEIKKGDRIAQLILEKVLTPEIRELGELAKTLRGEGGFGSTGTN